MSSKSVGKLRRQVAQSMKKLIVREPNGIIVYLHNCSFPARRSMIALVEAQTIVAWNNADRDQETYRLWGNLLRDAYRYEQKAGILPDRYQVVD